MPFNTSGLISIEVKVLADVGVVVFLEGLGVLLPTVTGMSVPGVQAEKTRAMRARRHIRERLFFI